jgi:hypothetical protein
MVGLPVRAVKNGGNAGVFCSVTEVTAVTRFFDMPLESGSGCVVLRVRVQSRGCRRAGFKSFGAITAAVMDNPQYNMG